MSHKKSDPIRTYVLVGGPNISNNPPYLHTYEVNLNVILQGQDPDSQWMQQIINQTLDTEIHKADSHIPPITEDVTLHPSVLLRSFRWDMLPITENSSDNDFTQIIAEEYRERGGAHLIMAKKGQSIEEALKGIKGPANLILDSHGGEGHFQWNSDELLPYSHLFNALPRKGVESIILASCQGGSAEREEFLKMAPAGALVLTMSSEKSLNLSSYTSDFVDETKHITHPMTLFLRVLDNFDPKGYKKSVESYTLKEDSNPALETPHLIGIGGVSPLVIDLPSEMNALAHGHSSSRSSAPINEVAWQQAISNVHKNFDTVQKRTDPTDVTMESRESLGPAAEKVLHHKINAIAAKIRKGVPVGNSGNTFNDATDLRIAYGLTAAYLDDSGQIRRWQKEQVAHAELHALEGLVLSHPASPAPLNKDALQEIRAFARQFHIGLPSNAELTDNDMEALGKALHVKANANLDTSLVNAMEDSIIAGRLPTPHSDKAKSRVID